MLAELLVLLLLLLPLLLLAALGGLLASTKLISSPWQAGLNELTAKLFIPALLFSGAYKNGIPAAVSWQFLAAFFVPLLALFVFSACAFGRDAPRALAASYSNTVFVGIPVLTLAFGADSLQYAFPIIAFHSLVAFSLYYLAGASGPKVLPSLLSAVKNPIVTSLMLGLACNLLGVALPELVTGVLSILSTAALPCALLALGASLVRYRVRRWRASASIVFVKLVVLPACVYGLAGFVFRLPAPASAVLVVIAACPVGVNAAALVQADGRDPAPVSSAIVLSCLACIVTISLWIGIVRAL